MLTDIPPSLLKEIEEMLRFPDQGMEHPGPTSSNRCPSSSDKGTVLCLPCSTCKERTKARYLSPKWRSLS